MFELPDPESNMGGPHAVTADTGSIDCRVDYLISIHKDEPAGPRNFAHIYLD